jgi:hypothetical protein
MERKSQWTKHLSSEARSWWIRIALPLSGALLCLHVYSGQNALGEYSTGNTAVDRIRLESCDQFEVVHEIEYDRDSMFEGEFHQDCLENRHIFVHGQYIRFHGEVCSVRYLEFRAEDDAEWAREQATHWTGRLGLRPTYLRTFGKFLLIVEGLETVSQQFSAFALELVEKQFQPGKATGRV